MIEPKYQFRFCCERKKQNQGKLHRRNGNKKVDVEQESSIPLLRLVSPISKLKRQPLTAKITLRKKANIQYLFSYSVYSSYANDISVQRCLV